MEITGATLLSKEEYEASKDNIPPFDNWWWLRSPSIYDKYYNQAVCVDGDYGNLIDSGENVALGEIGVRPALCISNLSSSNLQIGDKFEFGDRNFTIISDKYALCDESIGECVFRMDWTAEDANDYEASDVKKYIDDWFIRMKDIPIYVYGEVNCEFNVDKFTWGYNLKKIEEQKEDKEL